jgi:hypothetical protein
MAAAIGRDIESIYQGNNRGVLADVDLLQRITEACRACVREFVRERTGMDGRIGANFLPSLLKWTGFYQEPLTRALQVRVCASRFRCSVQDSSPDQQLNAAASAVAEDAVAYHVQPVQCCCNMLLKTF